VETVDSLDLSRIKAMSGVNLELASCHTAFVNGYVIEGHVRAAEHHAVMPSPAHRHLRDLGSPIVGHEGSTAGTPQVDGVAITRP
jgi:hypothetical protein